MGNHDGNLCLVNCFLSLCFGKFASFSECDRLFGFLYQVSGVVNSSGSFVYHFVVSYNSPFGYNNGSVNYSSYHVVGDNVDCLGVNNRNHVLLDDRLDFDMVGVMVTVDVNSSVLNILEMGKRILSPVLLSCGGNITTGGVVSSVDA